MLIRFEQIKTLYLPCLLRAVLGILFIWSGLEKFMHPMVFQQAVQNYHVLPDVWGVFYAHILPWFEVLAGLYLFLGLFTKFAVFITSGLLLSFMIAMIIVLLRNQAPDCGCFIGGTDNDPVSVWLVVRDFVMLVGAAYVFYFPGTTFSLDGWFREDATANKGKKAKLS